MAQVDFKRLPPALARDLVAEPPYSSQRNFGASTLEWCYVAAGRFDVYLHGGQKLWDYAAGSLVLEEAGGLMCTLDHDDFWADIAVEAFGHSSARSPLVRRLEALDPRPPVASRRPLNASRLRLRRRGAVP